MTDEKYAAEVVEKCRARAEAARRREEEERVRKLAARRRARPIDVRRQDLHLRDLPPGDR